jgi:FkbM family methyltransferase
MLATRIKKVTRAAASPRLLHGLLHGVLAGVEHIGALKVVGECRTVVDIGANRGQFALVARHCFPNSTILSFEPLGAPGDKYLTLFGNDRHVRLHKAAIGPDEGQATLHVSRRDDSSSLLAIMPLQVTLFPGTDEASTQRVAVAPLDKFLGADEIEQPALLKLDVQGYELQALRGCERLLARFTHVYVECSFVELYCGQALADTVIDWLRLRGFRLLGVYNLITDRSGRSVQGDFLFAARSSAFAEQKVA